MLKYINDARSHERKMSDLSYAFLSWLLFSPTQVVWPYGLMSFTQCWHWQGCGLKYHRCYYYYYYC